MKYHSKLLLALAAAACVISCDSGSNAADTKASTIPVGAQAQRIGLVSIQRDNSQGETKTVASANFIKTSVAQEVRPAIEEFDHNNGTCEVLPIEDSLYRGSQTSATEIQTTPISAGATVVITDGTAQYATLTPDAQLNYNTPYDFKDELPENMTANILGSEFPRISAAFPTVRPLQVTSPTTVLDARIDSPLLWESNNQSHSKIDIAISGENSNEALVVYCHAADDGYFELPEEIKDALGSDFEFSFLVMVRETAKFTYTDNTLLITIVSPAPYHVGDGEFALGLGTSAVEF